MQAIISTYTGTPSPDQAHRLMWEASLILSGRMSVRFARQAKMLSGAWLLHLTGHSHPHVASAARKACLRFGITAPVSMGVMEGDRA